MKTSQKNQKNLDPKPLNQVLNHTQLRQIIRHSNELKRLEEFIHARLPMELKEHCHVINWREETLILAASSAAYATRLRYLGEELLTLINNKLNTVIKHLKILVRQIS